MQLYLSFLLFFGFACALFVVYFYSSRIMSDWLRPAGAVILPFLGGAFGSKFTSKGVKTWYKV